LVTLWVPPFSAVTGRHQVQNKQNMKHILLFFILIFCLTEIDGQSEAKKQFNQGLKQFKNKNLSLADSLFQLSLAEEPSIEKFKTLAKMYKENGDLCRSKPAARGNGGAAR
jgi:hypothetical protein